MIVVIVDGGGDEEDDRSDDDGRNVIKRVGRGRWGRQRGGRGGER